MPLPIRQLEQGLQFAATIQPRASRNEISGIHNGTLKLKLTSPPVDGAANKACLRFLAKSLGVSASRITLVSGATSRNKVFQIDGMDEPTFMQKLNSILNS